MEVTLEELLRGQKTQIKNNIYFATEAYVKPFFERMSKFTNTFDIHAVTPPQITINPDGSENIVYNKVLIEAILPGDSLDYSEVIGMAYGLDIRKPLAKFFRCIKETAHGSLLINSDTFIDIQELEPETPIKYGAVERLMEKDFDMFDWKSKIAEIPFDATNDNINYNLGQWIRFAINFNVGNYDFGKVKIATNDIIAAYKNLWEDSKSDFFTSPGVPTNYLHIYNAMSDIIYNGKDILNVVDKSYLLKSILSLV